MRLAAMFDAGQRPADEARHIADFERAGLELVLVPESYGYDAISTAGYIAAVTRSVQVGTGIVNVFSRTPAVLAMSAATIDALSGGRFVLGLGASGAQVIEGFHGVGYDSYQGRTISLPLGGGEGGRRPVKLINRPVRSSIPIWWASVTERSVEQAAEHADGWMPPFFVPEKAAAVWGRALEAGQARRSVDRPPLEVIAGGVLAVDEKLIGSRRQEVLDLARPKTAMYVGGMGTPQRNFYNDLCRRYGFEAEAERVKHFFSAGERRAAEAAIPQQLLEFSNFVGPSSLIRDRVDAFRAAGATTLLVEPIGENRVESIKAMRSILDNPS
jgi:alkanesulfonate monooxygenase SsuD/methylene tetrahydromethanopterin reductase-like flavin-dependent oxidoreductase (luciferase family)